jgi:hypothetical protein
MHTASATRLKTWMATKNRAWDASERLEPKHIVYLDRRSGALVSFFFFLFFNYFAKYFPLLSRVPRHSIFELELWAQKLKEVEGKRSEGGREYIQALPRRGFTKGCRRPGPSWAIGKSFFSHTGSTTMAMYTRHRAILLYIATFSPRQSRHSEVFKFFCI